MSRIVVVTGASRGAGKGIALALGGKGDIVYVTGRSRREGDASLPGTIDKTAAEITRLGGNGIAVACDCGDVEQIAALFAQVEHEHGRLDILVNNAASIHDDLIEPGPFWHKSPGLVDIIDVGLRSSYLASYYAAPLLVKNGHGLIVNTSSFGARCYMHGPAYGAQKAGHDKMAHDMAVDFKPFNIAAVSIWMGMLRTERIERVIAAAPEKYAGFVDIMESPQLTGLVIDSLYNDAALLEKSGRTLIAAEEAQHYGIQDLNGTQPPSHRQLLGEPIIWSPAFVA